MPKNIPKPTPPTAAADDQALKVGYTTPYGTMYVEKVESFLASAEAAQVRGKVNLIFTSPPFLLNRKKKYGNEEGEAYVDWLRDLAPRLTELLAPDGSIVMELGNAWKPGEPAMTPLVMEAFLAFLKAGKLELCQQFIWDNPARLPSPAQWVNVKRVRVKDSFTHVWWMSPTSSPKADNRNVLTEYSDSMKKLLKTQKYNSGIRPSGHNISPTGFLKEHKGAIPSNVLRYSELTDEEAVEFEQFSLLSNVLRIANTSAGDVYRRYCDEHGLVHHPAPMPMKLVEFFVKLLTDEGDLVYDPFGGSNTTGAASEGLARRWIATEPDATYVAGSRGRFTSVIDD